MPKPRRHFLLSAGIGAATLTGLGLVLSQALSLSYLLVGAGLGLLVEQVAFWIRRPT